jgi:CheY-like chemotaxis protein
MFRILLLLGVLFSAGSVFAQEPPDNEPVGIPFAVSVRDKELLLEKTESALKWFRSLNTADRQRLSVKDFRSKILPLELIQTAAILKQKQQPDLARMVREILPFLQPTPLECFEIRERLGDDVLDSFQEERELLTGDTPDSTTRIKTGADRFLKEFLNPAEKIALHREPQSAAEIMNAVDQLAFAGRPTVIRYYLRKFLDANAEPADYAQIAQSLGARKLLQIANNKDFDPHGKNAAAKITAEAKKYWQDEQVVAESLENLQSPENAAEYKKSRNLLNDNNSALPQLVEKLGETQDLQKLREIQEMLQAFSAEGREALAAALNSTNPDLVFNAAACLAYLIRPDEKFLLYPALFAPAPTSPLSDEQRRPIVQTLENRKITLPNPNTAAENAAAELCSRANDYLTKKRSLNPQFDGVVRFWDWDEKEQKIQSRQLSLPAAYRFFARRYAEFAYKIKPEIREIQRLFLITLFEYTAYNNGLDSPLNVNNTGLAETLAKIEPDPKQQSALLQQILRNSIEKEFYAAAQTAAGLLGVSKDRELLTPTPDAKPSSLVQAVVAKNRRVRFAALETIMSLQPNAPYAGSSFVAESLVWFAKADGQHRLIAAHPNLTNAAKTAGFFIDCGYRGELAQTCRDAMKLAANSPDTEIVVVDSITPEPAVADFVQEMRQDPRTAHIPIAVLTDNFAPPDLPHGFQNRSEMQFIDQLRPNAPFALALAQTYPRIVNSEGAKWLNNDLLAKTDAEPVPPNVRVQQAHKALGWIKTILETSQNGRKIYHFEELEDTVRQALRSDVNIGQGLELAAAVKSPAMQAAICETAANALLALELRRKAAEMFGKSVETFGVLLRGQQLQQLYDKYNLTESEPKETQELLGSLIDLVEQKINNNEKKP